MVLRDYFYDGKWHRSVSLRSHDASTLVYAPSSTAAVHIRQLTNTALSHMYECIHTHKTIREDILLCPRCPVFCIHAEISYRWALRYPLPLGLCKHALIEAGTVDCMVLSHHSWYNAEGQLGHVGHCSWCWEHVSWGDDDTPVSKLCRCFKTSSNAEPSPERCRRWRQSHEVWEDEGRMNLRPQCYNQ